MMQDLPFEIPPGQPPLVIVAARADRQPLAMLLDTGNAAPFDILLTPEAAARIAGEPPPAATPTVPGAPPAGGVIQPRPLRKFRLGPVRLRNLTAGVNPAMNVVAQHLGRPVDGIVGYRFLKGRTVSVDYGKRRVDLDAATPRTAPTGFTLAPASPLTLVKVTLNGKGPFQFVLDTGASATLVSRATADAAGLGTGEKVNIAGPGGAVQGGARLVQARIALGDYARDGRNVAIAKSLAPLAMAAGATIDGVLGADFFEGARVTFDYAGNQLWILPAKTAR